MAVAPDLPARPVYLQTFCVDPGVPSLRNLTEAVDVVGTTRVYAACERRKHIDNGKFYDNARARYRGTN